MAITAAQVKELREKTGLGMMDCKKAITKADGDVTKAIEELRKAGEIKAAKKATVLPLKVLLLHTFTQITNWVCFLKSVVKLIS